MKICVISDTHDNLYAVDGFAEKVRGKVELILHAGDIVAPFVVKSLKKANCKVIAVYGNNDGDKLLLKKKFEESGFEIHPPPHIFEIGGKKVLLMHFPDFVEEIAHSGEFDLIIYGHTHKVDVRKIGNTLILNPGELGGWLSGKNTYCLLDISTMSYKIEEIRRG